MVNSGNLEIDVTIVAEAGTTLRELKNLRLSLFSEMEQELSGDNVEIYQESSSRSVDPAIIGTVTLILLPILVEKATDIILKWAELRKDCSITISIPVKGAPPVVITYDPRTISQANLNSWKNSAIETIKQSKKMG